jgi:phosphoribosylaminoimidazole-succinocarboxamide synthase
MPPLTSLDLPGIKKLRSGKVREVFDLGETLLFVATDRISAFDCILPDPIPDKGAVLNQLSAFWFHRFDFVPNHMIALQYNIPELNPFSDQLRRRSMIVRKAEPLPIECVVRGYLAGSGWKEYQERGTVCGHQLPAGLELASELPEPIFTPATKSESGHDINIDWEECCRLVGEDVATEARDYSLQIYRAGCEHAAKCGIIVADTKFEFGRRADGTVILADEVLTPDSSRFWPAARWQPGGPQPSYDKQYVRDWLTSAEAGWDRASGAPPPELPAYVVERTRATYVEAYERLTREAF